MLDTILGFLSSLDRLEVILALASIFFAYMLRTAQIKKDAFDLRDLLVDENTGRVSIYKLGQLIALLLSSWGFIYLTLHDKLSESYFGLYMATWAGAHVLSQAATSFATRSDVPVPPIANPK